MPRWKLFINTLTNSYSLKNDWVNPHCTHFWWMIIFKFSTQQWRLTKINSKNKWGSFRSTFTATKLLAFHIHIRVCQTHTRDNNWGQRCTIQFWVQLCNCLRCGHGWFTDLQLHCVHKRAYDSTFISTHPKKFWCKYLLEFKMVQNAVVMEKTLHQLNFNRAIIVKSFSKYRRDWLIRAYSY